MRNIATLFAALLLPMTAAAIVPTTVTPAAPGPIRVISKSGMKKLTPVTTTIMTQTPAGTPMQDVVWSSRACYVENGAAKWVEITGFVPNIITNGNKIYIYSPITQLSEIASAWIEGEISADGKKAIFHTPQAYMINEATPGVPTMLYATRVSSTTGKPETGNLDLVFDIDAEGNMIQSDGGLLSLSDEQGNFYGYGDMNINITKINEKVVVLPEGAEPATYVLNFEKDGYDDRQSALIAFVGDDVYFSDPLGIQDSWFKGVRSGNTITVTTGQYMGSKSGYPMYLTVAEAFKRTEMSPLGEPYEVTDYTVIPDATLTFEVDPANGEISSKQLMLMTTSPTERGTAYAAFDKPNFVPWAAHPATPETPVITYYLDLGEYADLGLSGCMVLYDVPSYDNESEFLPQEDIYYEICFDGKPLEFYETTMIPYYGQFQDAALGAAISAAGDSHQLQLTYTPEKSISIQSFYYLNEEVYPSEKSSYHFEDGVLVPDGSGVASNFDSATVVGINNYDLTGCRVSADYKGGVVIRESVLSDGTRRVEKIVRK